MRWLRGVVRRGSVEYLVFKFCGATRSSEHFVNTGMHLIKVQEEMAYTQSLC